MKTTFIEIQNAGAEISSTNYFDTEHAAQGLFYLTANAGEWRLLCPDSQHGTLDEMKTGRRVCIEDSIFRPGVCVDVVWDDGSPAPFALTMDRKQVDRRLERGDCALSVWGRDGKLASWPCAVRVDSDDTLGASVNTPVVIVG